ncbi:hypothetical protein A2368_03865 [Candidatus Collierbacteria bacterium RIFOXYB1_FULL_49_13]|uniref:Uncharacterized protein n=1 Tax=Candidatus Collierbacteria bacterium RIFOXYB1_FULL_49_13 TaxID=1817728 RepID=A0A1F5FJ94_9BACT|nr:MAG: hypothetical protein A2368_03865 [Candidatus Collierbacteria bacterium RIFOXYB1_FULL_49_13]
MQQRHALPQRAEWGVDEYPIHDIVAERVNSGAVACYIFCALFFAGIVFIANQLDPKVAGVLIFLGMVAFVVSLSAKVSRRGK